MAYYLGIRKQREACIAHALLNLYGHPPLALTLLKFIKKYKQCCPIHLPEQSVVLDRDHGSLYMWSVISTVPFHTIEEATGAAQEVAEETGARVCVFELGPVFAPLELLGDCHAA